jgi:hypothetical protein
MMRAVNAMAMVVALLLTATQTNAMSGHEYLKVYDDGSASDRAAVMEPLVRQFVKEGYHSVPDWPELNRITRALILKKGYGGKNIAEIAKEAAIAHGMSK